MRRSIRRATTIVISITTPTTTRRCQRGMRLYSTAQRNPLPTRGGGRQERARLGPCPRVDEHRRCFAAKEHDVDRQPPTLVRIDRRERLPDGREAALAVDEHVDGHSGLRPAKPSS